MLVPLVPVYHLSLRSHKSDGTSSWKEKRSDSHILVFAEVECTCSIVSFVPAPETSCKLSRRDWLERLVGDRSSVGLGGQRFGFTVVCGIA
jgi:hypothetical protein